MKARAKAIERKGSDFYSRDQLPQALRYFEQALALGDQLDDTEIRRNAHAHLASYYNTTCAWDKVVHHQQIRLSLSQELRDTQDRALAFGNLGPYFLPNIRTH